MGDRASTTPSPPAPAERAETAFSNGVRLTGREWLAVGLFSGLLILFAPSLWPRFEPLPVDPDYRMPHDLSNDYWLYQRTVERAAAQHEVLLLGDSVIWGEYVTPQETLSHFLNEQLGREACANLGLDGAHPLALTGLVEHYASRVVGKKVLLQCNPLWMSSARADLQEERATEFNHPRLVPQFMPRIPSYHEEVSTRLGTVIEQHVPMSRWTNHLQQAYYGRTDLPSWTLEHPYENPLTPLKHGLPPFDNSRRHPPRPWYENGIGQQDYPWVDAATSLQWQAFQRVVRLLQARGNALFVLVGPFNEHLLKEASRQRYERLRATIAAWLEAERIAHALPPPLRSEQYGDASHPLAAGYMELARQLLREPFFGGAGAK